MTYVELSADVLTTDGHQERTIRFDKDSTTKFIDHDYRTDKNTYDSNRERQMYYYVES